MRARGRQRRPHVRHLSPAQPTTGLDFSISVPCKRPLWRFCAAPPRRRHHSDRSVVAIYAAVASGRFVPQTDVSANKMLHDARMAAMTGRTAAT